MKRATNRAGRFFERQNRYRNRLNRREQSYPHCCNRGTAFETGVHHDGPTVFEGDGRRQQSLHDLLKNPKHGTRPPESLAPPPIVTHAGYKKPPHVSWPGGWPYPRLHQKESAFNYHNRPLTYQGRKVGRLNGFQRRVSFASMKSYIFLKMYGYRAWPDDDPLGRTPTFSAEDFGWGDRVYGPPCH